MDANEFRDSIADSVLEALTIAFAAVIGWIGLSMIFG
jgi:hypothetical protein